MKNLSITKVITFNTLIMSMMISGCSTYGMYEDAVRKTEVDRDTILNSIESHQYQKVAVLDKPPRIIKEIDHKIRPLWLDDETKIVVNDLPLSLVLKQIVGDNIPIKYGYSVDPNITISNLFFEGKKEEALNILSLTSSYGITADEEKITVDKFLTKTYTLPTVIGDSANMLGSSGSSSSSSAEDAASGEFTSTGGGDGQFSSQEVDNYNLTEQIYEGITKILSGEGSITTGTEDQSKLQANSSSRNNVLGYAEKIKGLSTIVVRTSPAMMKLIDEYVEFTIDEMTKQVELEITVLEYQSTSGSEFGVDAALSYTNGDDSYGLTTVAPDLTDSISGFGVSSSVVDGSWSGTSLLINALRTSGDVSVNTQERITASNHKAQEFDASTTTTYFESVEVTVDDDDDDTTTDITIGYVQDGVKMLAIPNIQKDRVYLTLSGTLSKVINLDEDTINEITITKPTTRQSRFNITGSYEYNKPFIVARMRQESYEGNKTSLADIEVGNNSDKEIIDTLVVITPRLVKINKAQTKTL